MSPPFQARVGSRSSLVYLLVSVLVGLFEIGEGRVCVRADGIIQQSGKAW